MEGRVVRTCGPCTLCCTLLAIPEIQKPAGSRCEHVCDAGCSVYADRPYSCRKFECLWLKGETPEWARPDNIGVVFDVMKPRITGKTMPVLVIEEFSGAHKQEIVRPIIDEFDATRDVLIVSRDNVAKLYTKDTK